MLNLLIAGLLIPTLVYDTTSAEVSSQLEPIPIKNVSIPVLSDQPSTVILTSVLLLK